MNTVEDNKIREMWKSCAFMNVLKIEIMEIHNGGATLRMPIDLNLHTNHWLGVHGGAIASLADSINGVTCASIGKIVQTLNMNINFISNVQGGVLIAKSEILHAGQSTINVRANVYDEQGNMICDISTIMFVAGDLV